MIAAGIVLYICYVVDIDPGPVIDFLGPPCCWGSKEMEDSRIPDLQESPGVDIDPGSVMDFLGAPCCRGPTEMEDSRIPDFQECPGASCEASGDVDVAYPMGTDMQAPETVVGSSGKGVPAGLFDLNHLI